MGGATGWMRTAAAVLAAAALASSCGPAGTGRPAGGSVARVVDGDTLVLDDGRRVRLVQIDAPELSGEECHARAASAELLRLAPPGTAVRLELDPALDAADRFGRVLAYVWRGDTNVNEELVRRGAATVWFYGGTRGRYAERLLAQASTARRAGRGLWGSCPVAVWDPAVAATTGAASQG